MESQVRFFRFSKRNSLFVQVWSKKKNQNCQFKLKFGNEGFNGVVYFFCFRLETPFLANLVQKLNIVSLKVH